MKKLLKWGIIIIVGIAVISAIASGGEDEATSTEPDDSEESSGNEEAAAEEETAEGDTAEEKTASIGDTLTVGDVEFNISGKDTADNVGGEYGQDASSKYLILDAEVTNKGNESITTDTSFFKLKSGEKTYEADGTASMYANEQAEFFLTEVNPDVSAAGKVVFDVPEDVINSDDLKVQVQTGAFGTETGVISLVK